MLYINNLPVVSGPNIHNKIVLTDTAKSELSVVHLKKQDAPVKNEFVWVTIQDPHYNPEDPDSPRYMLSRWMLVDQILYIDYIDPYVRDSSGEVILDEADKPIRRSLRDADGYVKIILREVKHTLTLSATEKDYNLPGKLPLILYGNNLTAVFPLRNEITFTQIKNLFSEMGSLFEFNDGDMPPGKPYNLFWANKNLAECLDDLLQSYSCRVVETANLRPGDSEVREYDPLVIGKDDFRIPQFNKLIWKRRQYVNFDTDIIYDNICYTEDTEAYREKEKEQTYFAFPSIQNRDLLFLPEVSGTQVHRKVTFDKAYSVDDPANLIEYLQSTHINYDLIYSFETKRLPESFLLEEDWSKIRYEFYDNSYTIYVDHYRRPVPSVPSSYTLAQDSPEFWTGKVTFTDGVSVIIDSLRQIDSQEYEDEVINSITLPMEGVDPSSVGSKVFFMVASNTLVPLSFSDSLNLYADDLVAPPLHNGVEVLGIKHTIPGLTMECDDEVLSFGRDPIYDYTLDSYMFNSLATSPNEFVYPIELPENENQKWFFKVPDYRYWLYVRFRLKATQEELIQFIKDNDEHNFGDIYNETLGEIWFKNMEYIGLYFTFTQSPYNLAWSFQYLKPSDTYASTSMNKFIRTPEITTSSFSVLNQSIDPLDPIHSFPLVFGDPNTDLSLFRGSFGSFISNNSLTINRANTALALGTYYIAKHLHTFGGEIDLIQ